MNKPPVNDLPLMEPDEGIVLFYPHMPKNAKKYINEVLDSRWIGQGPKVDLFEQRFKEYLGLKGEALAVGSGTDALHLAYLLAGIQAGDEVIVPLFTCTATSIPLLYIGAIPVFADIDPKTLNILPASIESKITEKTKAIVCVHYGGLPCDMDEIRAIALKYNIPVIEDAAHALGASYKGTKIGNISEFTIFSFQAIKHLTTGDGGMLVISDPSLKKLASRLRWFGIDREDKQRGVWENDIKEVGYKYQMTDIGAALGLAGLEDFDATLNHRQTLYKAYLENLSNHSNIEIADDGKSDKVHAAWLFTIFASNRKKLQQILRENGVESGQTHYRNDRYSIFNSVDNFPNMDRIEDNYLILPLHTKMNVLDVHRICHLIKNFAD